MADTKRQIQISHFSHRHMLRLVESAEDEIIFCGMCQEEIVLGTSVECASIASIHPVSNSLDRYGTPFILITVLFSTVILYRARICSTHIIAAKVRNFCLLEKKLDLLCQKEKSFGASGRNDGECEYHFELRYAALIPSDKHHNPAVYIKHQHPLIVCEKPKKYQYTCSCCAEPFHHNDLIYVCLECNYLLHESSIALPNEIKHAFHPEHALTTHQDDRGFFPCNLCSNYGYACLYRCLACNFRLDLFCANLMPTTNDFAPDQGKQIQLNHPHPLIQCNSIKDFRHPCFGCGLSFDHDSIYVCLHCRILLHKSCAEMPSEIVHTFHPQHPLRLHIISPTCGWPYCSSTCRGCRKGAGSFVYDCQDHGSKTRPSHNRNEFHPSDTAPVYGGVAGIGFDSP